MFLGLFVCTSPSFFLLTWQFCSQSLLLFARGDVDDFMAHPSHDKLQLCPKEHLIFVANNFGITVSKWARKQVIKSELLAALSDKGVLSSSAAMMSSPAKQEPGEQLCLKELELEMCRLAIEEKELSVKIKEKELQNELELRKMEVKGQLRLKELELKWTSTTDVFQSDVFDVNKCIRLITPFDEHDVNKYFTLFERVADTLKWLRNVWSLLLQCVFTGKAQEAYASLLPELSLDYDKVKTAVLRAYELVPEAYLQMFGRFKKGDNQTFVEFGHEKETLFDRWCQSKNVNDFDKLRDLILLEEFKNCLPDKIVLP